MQWRLCPCAREIHAGTAEGTLTRSGVRGIIMRSRIPNDTDRIASDYAGRIQTIYLDPPFDTGKPYVLRLPIGEEGWRKGRTLATLQAYNDRWGLGEYERTIRAAIRAAHAMLKDEGALFLHIDPQRGPFMRRILDEVFGERHFVNEIVWAYETGGRSTGYFSRKHDVLLFYRKTERLRFDITAAAMPRARRHNHMRRGVDGEGRAYSAIDVGGKEYRYYDDEPVYPSDVWTDIAPLQQRDPRRTGYDTQKPAALVARAVGCTSSPGDWVADLFAGSGTTGRAAADMGRNFLCADASDTSIITMRRRLLDGAFELDAPCSTFSEDDAPVLTADARESGGAMVATLVGYDAGRGCAYPTEGLTHADQWSFGVMRGDTFHAYASAARDKRHPALEDTLMFDAGLVGADAAAVIVCDIQGRRAAYRMTRDG